MPLSILVVALLLIATGLGGILLGLSLTPTDMGRAWLDIGFTVLTGGMITLALGYATRAVVSALERLPLAATPAATVAVPEPLVREEPAQPLAPVLATGAVVAAGAAALAVSNADKDPAPKEPQLEDIEQDLFSQMLAEPQPAVGVQEPEPIVAPVEPPPSPKPVDAEAFELRLSEEPELVHETEPKLVAAPLTAEPVAEGDAEAEHPATAPDTPAGLIPDEDLAALAAQDDALAPLSTLEIVGAYDSAGVRFTMYSDGSVNAVAPHGERRYRSLEALRQQLDSGQPAV